METIENNKNTCKTKQINEHSKHKGETLRFTKKTLQLKINKQEPQYEERNIITKKANSEHKSQTLKIHENNT